MFKDGYIKQVALLIQCLPEIQKQSCFAIKGGTAINLFVRDMPRLSVDIDLTYLPLSNREEALGGLLAAMNELTRDLKHSIPGCRIQPTYAHGIVTKLVVATADAHIKIEPNTIFRGSVYGASKRELCVTAQERFERFATANVLSVADLYAGKICAALDRQHPRDLYDVYQLLKNEGLTSDIRRAFVVYLASHSRPIHELLKPNLKDIAHVYATEFAGMAREDVPLEKLLRAREEIGHLIRTGLTAEERHFLLSMKQGDPDWQSLGVNCLNEFPSLQWKLRNIRQMESSKRAEALGNLRAVLEQ
jgi:predicted nucleotidyltransferase component of viral defense system